MYKGSKVTFILVAAGKGRRFPRFLRIYLTWVLPILLFAIFAIGYWKKFA